MPTRWPALLLALVALLGAGAGCAHRQPLADPTRTHVRRVAVEGNEELRGPRVRDALATTRTPWWAIPLQLRRFWVPLDRELVLEDQTRLVRFYEAMGFFDARAVGLGIEYRGKEVGDTRRWAVVTFTVEEGPRSEVREVRILGTDGLDEDLRERLEDTPRLSRGDPFELPRQRDDQEALRGVLLDGGYAHAEVERQADVYPDERAVDLTYTIDSGPLCHYGRIEIEGLENVPRPRVEREIDFGPGDEYARSDLRELQADLFGLGVFSLVTVTPRLEDGTPAVIDVLVTLREAPPITVELGGGVGLERGRDDAHASFLFNHQNVGGLLVQLHSYNEFGWAVVPDVFSPRSHGPIGQGELAVIEPTPLTWLQLRQRVTFLADVESGYSYLSPQVTAGTTFRLHRRLSLNVSYNFKFYWLYQRDPELFHERLRHRVPEVDTDGLYTLSYLSQQITWDAREDPLFTRRGVFARGSVSEAGLGGSFEYLKFSADLRGYVDPVRDVLILALRVQGGLILPLADTDSAPLSQRFKTGGSASVRGWTRDLLGPRYYPTTCESGDPCGSDSCGRRECDPFPLGGHVMLAGGPEVRFYPVQVQQWRFGGAVFLDVGRVWATTEQVSWEGLMWSVGGGLRVVSPVGIIRLDAAGRLNSAEMFEGAPKFLVHFGLGEAF